MNVLKVIVDEVPYGCEECYWMDYDGYCAFTNKATGEPDERPEWCPLVGMPKDGDGALLITTPDNSGVLIQFEIESEDPQ